MADSIEPAGEKNPLELAVPVAQRVEIKDVLLIGCAAHRTFNLGLGSKETKTQCSVSEVKFGKNAESNILYVIIDFEFASTRFRGEESERTLDITASFLLAYSVSSFDGVEDENLEAFSVTNGVYNAWPYWREFVQNTAARMGVRRGIMLPVFRLGENPFDEQPCVVDPATEQS
jgi:hypothetical protein